MRSSKSWDIPIHRSPCAMLTSAPRPCRMRPTVRQWRFTMPAEEGINPRPTAAILGRGRGETPPTRPEWLPTCHDSRRPWPSVMGWAGGAPRAPWGCVRIGVSESKAGSSAVCFCLGGLTGTAGNGSWGAIPAGCVSQKGRLAKSRFCELEYW